MPTFIDALARVKPRLLATTPLIAAGAVASFAMAPGLPAGVIVALGSLAGNIAATDVHALLSERVLDDDILKNHHLVRAIRDAISAIIRHAATDISDEEQRAALEKTAIIDEKLWAEAEATIWQPQTIAGLSTDEIVEMFSKSPEDFARFKILNLETWREIVGGLAAVHSFAVEGDAISSSGSLKLSHTTVDHAASRLHDTFARALYEILKKDFAKGGEAYGGLLMKLVGSISARRVETLETAYEILGLTRTILTNTEEIKSHVIEVKDEIKALRDLTKRDAHTKRLVINLPPNNQIFTGRRDVLDALKAELEKNKRVALSGMPGVGKTQTAVEYAHRQYAAQVYDYVIYTRAASETELLADFVMAAQVLNLPAKDNANFNVVAASVKAWLEGAQKWLLIFDNADDLSVVRPHIPINPTGQVILTRRPDDAGGLAHSIRIKKMEVREGALLLLRRARFVTDDETLEAITSDNLEQAQAISRELDGLPLSLNIAGAFIKETSITSLGEYLELYRTEGKKLRQERDSTSGYEYSVRTIFAMAFKQVLTPAESTEESTIIAHAAGDLLRLCAFLASDAIPLGLILADVSAASEDLHRALDNKIWHKKTIARAIRYALLETTQKEQTYDMHREIQAIMRDMMDNETQHLWAGRALESLLTNFPDPSNFAMWEKCDSVLPHAHACLKFGSSLRIETEAVVELSNITGFHLYNRARFVEAQLLYEQGLELGKKLLGSEHENVASIMNNLAELYRAQGRYVEAESLFRQALNIEKKRLGAEHPEVALGMNNLAELYRAQARYEEAEPLYVQALDILMRSSGSEHPHIAFSMNNLALLYNELARYEDAEPLFSQALLLLKKLFGPEHPTVASAMNNLAELYLRQSHNEEAEPLLVEVLRLRKSLLGVEHPEVAQSMNNLAGLYARQGRYAEAEPLFDEALGLLKKLFGPEHPLIVASMNNLAGLYTNQGRYAEAELMLVDSLELRKKLFGPEHPAVAISLNNLAQFYHQQERYAEAEPFYEQAVSMFEKVIGVNHPHTIIARRNFEMLKRRKA